VAFAMSQRTPEQAHTALRMTPAAPQYKGASKSTRCFSSAAWI